MAEDLGQLVRENRCVIVFLPEDGFFLVSPKPHYLASPFLSGNFKQISSSTKVG